MNKLELFKRLAQANIYNDLSLLQKLEIFANFNVLGKLQAQVEEGKITQKEFDEIYFAIREYNESKILHNLSPETRAKLHWFVLFSYKTVNKLKGITTEVIKDESTPVDGPVIYMPSHVGRYDIQALTVAMGYFYNLVSGDFEHIHGKPDGAYLEMNGVTLFNENNKLDRGTVVPRVVALAVQKISIMLFPEGTWNTTEEKSVLEFYLGCILSSLCYFLKTGYRLPLIPIGMDQEDMHFRINILENFDPVEYVLGDKEYKDIKNVNNKKYMADYSRLEQFLNDYLEKNDPCDFQNMSVEDMLDILLNSFKQEIIDLVYFTRDILATAKYEIVETKVVEGIAITKHDILAKVLKIGTNEELNQIFFDGKFKGKELKARLKLLNKQVKKNQIPFIYGFPDKELAKINVKLNQFYWYKTYQQKRHEEWKGFNGQHIANLVNVPKFVVSDTTIKDNEGNEYVIVSDHGKKIVMKKTSEGKLAQIQEESLPSQITAKLKMLRYGKEYDITDKRFDGLVQHIKGDKELTEKPLLSNGSVITERKNFATKYGTSISEIVTKSDGLCINKKTITTTENNQVNSLTIINTTSKEGFILNNGDIVYHHMVQKIEKRGNEVITITSAIVDGQEVILKKVIESNNERCDFEFDYRSSKDYSCKFVKATFDDGTVIEEKVAKEQLKDQDDVFTEELPKRLRKVA